MKILVIQHSAADAPAAATPVIGQPEHSVETVRIDRGDPIPQTVDADALMMFGGPISLSGRDRPVWVEQEQSLIRDYVHGGKRVFGICLGSQMIANALGAPVRRNAEPEIGWHVIEQVWDDCPIVADTFPAQSTVLQWHQDTFGIPNGATQLFRSRACENQGFTIDDRVFAFQFHLEATQRTIDLFLAVSSKWKQRGDFVQSEQEILSGARHHLESQSRILEAFLKRWLAE